MLRRFFFCVTGISCRYSHSDKLKMFLVVESPAVPSNLVSPGRSWSPTRTFALADRTAKAHGVRLVQTIQAARHAWQCRHICLHLTYINPFVNSWPKHKIHSHIHG
jgi:hypothetical protein